MTDTPYPSELGASDQEAESPRKGSVTGTLAWLGPILADETLDPTETLLMVGLADHVGDGDECFVGIATLAKYARVSYGTARRRLAALEQAGRLERSRRRRTDGNLSTYNWRLVRPGPARILRDDQRAPSCAMTSAHPDARTELPSVELPSTRKPSRGKSKSASKSEPPSDGSLDLSLPLSGSEQTAKDRAKVISASAEQLLKGWWESKTPRPTQNYPGARKVLERLLDTGWTEAEIMRALPGVPIISAKACELALRKAQPARAPAAPMDNDRDAPGGPVEYDPATGTWAVVAS